MINCTLLIQALHFGVAWFLLQRFLWPYLLAAYDAQKNSLERLEYDVQKEQQKARLEQERLTAEWSRIAQTCKRTAYLELEEKPFVIKQAVVEQPSEQMIQQQAQEAANILVKKVLDV